MRQESGLHGLHRPVTLMVAGTHSGVGKTTVTLTLLRAMTSRGLCVQPFKIGPDFIDTAYHAEITGSVCINLDSWMMGSDNIKSAFVRHSKDSDVALIEGMGGLYDAQPDTFPASNADVCKLLSARIILVIDIWGMTSSAGALLNGFLSFDPDLCFAGFVMNRAGSKRHAEMVLESLSGSLRELCLGYILHSDNLIIPERHLGLVTVLENEVNTLNRMTALDTASQKLDVDRLAPAVALHRELKSVCTRKPTPRTRIAIARDRAFSFYYAENLAALEEAGAELCPFQPTRDAGLPVDVDGLYLGGGYPESFAILLASNISLKEEIQNRTTQGMPIYSECGGFMYLGQSLTCFDGSLHLMASIFGLHTVMDPKYLAIRYVTVATLANSLIGPAGTQARGQEFHQSRVNGEVVGTPLYRVRASTGEEYDEGLIIHNAIGSYIHLHFASNRDIPRNFVNSCRAWRQREVSV